MNKTKIPRFAFRSPPRITVRISSVRRASQLHLNPRSLSVTCFRRLPTPQLFFFLFLFFLFLFFLSIFIVFALFRLPLSLCLATFPSPSSSRVY